MKLLSFGEVLWDVYPEDRFIGGAPLNFAAHCARHGLDTYMLSAVGNDELGAETLAQLKNWSLQTALVSVLPHKQTGKCLVTLDENSVPSYNLLQNVAWDEIPYQNAAGQAFDVLYFGTLALRSQVNLANLKALIAANDFRHIFVDVNIRPPFYSRASIRFALENATIVKISDEELPTVAAELGLACSDAQKENALLLTKQFPNIRLLLITLGNKGALAYDAATQTLTFRPAVPAEVKSTVGAGDSFGAAFLARYLEGQPIERCLEHATRVAAFVVSRFDAIPDYDPNGDFYGA